MTPRYAELQVTSPFSFLRSTSSAEELFAQAALYGIEALGIIDRNSLAGIVRAHEAARATGVRLVVGSRLDLADGTAVLAYPTDRPAYARLCHLLTLGKRRAGKGRCRLEWSDLAAYAEGLLAILVPDHADAACGRQLRRLREVFGDRAYLVLTLRRRPNDQLRLYELANLATPMRVATVVTNDVLFHAPARRILQDVVTCIRHKVAIDALGFRRERHADRHLKPPLEMHRLFSRCPEALERTSEITERCRFSLTELAYQYPEEAALCPPPSPRPSPKTAILHQRPNQCLAHDLPAAIHHAHAAPFQRDVDPGIMLHGCLPMMPGADPFGPRTHHHSEGQPPRRSEPAWTRYGM